MKFRSTLALLAGFCSTLVFASNPVVEIKTNQGTMVAELFADKAPTTVKNFLHYVDNGFYNGTLFHRSIPQFMVQGGGFLPGLKQKPTDAPIKNEASAALPNKPATLAMARTNDPDSATSQFFINLNDNKHLNFYKPEPGYIGYAVFGKVTKGFDIAQKIGGMPTHTVGAFDDVPSTDIVIESITRVAQAEAAPAPAKKPAKKKSSPKKKAA